MWLLANGKPSRKISEMCCKDIQNASQLEVFDLGIVVIVMVTFRVKLSNRQENWDQQNAEKEWTGLDGKTQQTPNGVSKVRNCGHKTITFHMFYLCPCLCLWNVSVYFHSVHLKRLFKSYF